MTDRGVVNARLEAVIRLRVRGPSGAEAELAAVLDTGYTGSLTLPAAVAALLGLERRSGGRAVLADGSVSRFATFAAEVLWGGSWVGVVASAGGARCWRACRFCRVGACGWRWCRAGRSRSGR